MSVAPLVYADTSVFGGVFDIEFHTRSRLFFESVLVGRYRLCISSTISDELERAPERVQRFYETMAAVAATTVDITLEADALVEEYSLCRLITAKTREDGFHMALATIAGCQMLVSWNYKHLLALDRREKFNAVNTLCGYNPVAIHSPLALIGQSNGKG